MYPQIVGKFLDQRNLYKRKMALAKDPLQKSIFNKTQLNCKLQANSFYGASGTKSSPQYKLQIALAITSAGRNVLNHLKTLTTQLGYPLLAWDTDAVNNQMPFKVTWEESDKLTNYLNSKLSEIYSNGHIQVGCEELMTHAVFSKAKKSYARIELDRNLYGSVTIKGIQWALINPELHGFVKQKCEQILRG